MLSRKPHHKLVCTGSFSLMAVLFIQRAAFAHPLHSTLYSMSMVETIYMAIGLLGGSILVVESRRFLQFIRNLGLFLIILAGVSFIGYRLGSLPKALSLLTSTTIGLGLALGIIGLWQWGYRQGYLQTIYIALVRRNRHGAKIRDHGQPNKVHQSYGKKKRSSFFKELHLQAEEIRQRRISKEEEFKSLYALIQQQLQQDLKLEHNASLTHQQLRQKQQIQTLLAEASHLCNQSKVDSFQLTSPSNSRYRHGNDKS